MDEDELSPIDNLWNEENMVSFVPESAPSDKVNTGNTYSDTPNSDLEELRAQLKQQADEIAALRAPKAQTQYQAPQYQVTNPQQYQVPTSPTSNRAQFKEQLQNAYLSDPAEAMLNLFDMAKKEAIEEARRSMVPVAGQTTRFAIDQFRKSQNLLQDEAEEFDNLVSQISDADMANVNPAMLSKQLEILKHAARGAALEKRTSRPQPRVPMYSVNDAIPRSTGGNKPVNVKLTKTQKEFWDIGIQNGLKPPQIMEIISGADGQGGIQ